MSEKPTDLFVRGYAAYMAGNADFVADLIADDIDWVLFGPMHIFPFAGPKRGKAAVLDTLAHVTRDYVTLKFEPRIMIEQGEWLSALVDLTERQIATGRTLYVRVALFLRYQGGRIRALQGVFDSFDMAEQAIGRPLGV